MIHAQQMFLVCNIIKIIQSLDEEYDLHISEIPQDQGFISYYNKLSEVISLRYANLHSLILFTKKLFFFL